MERRNQEGSGIVSDNMVVGYVLAPECEKTVWEHSDARLSLRCFARYGLLTGQILEHHPDVVILTREAVSTHYEDEDHLVEAIRAISDCGIVLQGEFEVGEQLPGNCDAVISAEPGLNDVVVAADAAIRRARSRRLGANDRAFVQSLMDSSRTLMLSIDRDLLVREFNRACEVVSGKSLQEVYGTSLESFVEEDLSDLAEMIGRERGRVFPEHRTLTFVGSDGARHIIECSLSPFFDEKGAVRLVVITGIDMTEQRATEAALRESEVAFRTLVESSPDAICVFAAKSHDWLYINPAGLELMGVESIEQIREHDIIELVTPKDRDSTRERLQTIADSGRPFPPTEVSLTRVDGAPIWVETVEIPLRYKGVKSFLTISRDQTERKELTARMMQLDRMVAVGTLAAGVGHEINNPLAYLTSNVEFAAEEVERVASGNGRHEALKEVALALDEALDGAFRVRNIVRDLKDLSRAESDATEPIDLETVVESALNMASHEIRTRATVRRDFQSVPLVHGSGSRVRRLLVNVLLNAAQSIPEGNPTERQLKISIFSHANDRVCLTVEDEGSGIAPDDLKRVFDPFFTTKPVGSGTGLGLTISQRIIESLGGSISIESEVGKGTKVSIEFIAITSEVEDDSELPSPSRQIPIRVLVLDDEPMIGASVRRALIANSDVVDFQSGQSALDYLTDDQDFDVILCDIVMPEMSGEEFYDNVRDRLPALADRFVFMTGGAFTDAAARFQDEHGERFIEKPFAAWELREILYGVASSS